MRTTIRIDDDLYREVKERAARAGRTVAAVLEDAVRRGVDTRVGLEDTRHQPDGVRTDGNAALVRGGSLRHRYCMS